MLIRIIGINYLPLRIILLLCRNKGPELANDDALNHSAFAEGSFLLAAVLANISIIIN